MERLSRWGLLVAAIALGIFGVVSFVLPDMASASFPWRVGPFLAMTVGAWALGTAAMAADTARTWRPAVVLPALVYLWLFGLAQLLVVIFFLDRLVVGPLAFPYLIGLGALIVSGIAGVAWFATQRPPLREPGERVPLLVRLSVVGFVVIVGTLAFLTARASDGGATTSGGFFPEPMGLFSARAFAGFFFALSMGALVLLLVARSGAPYRFYARTGLYLIVPITLASFIYLRLFDFAGTLGHTVYLAAYVVTGIIAAGLLVLYRPARSDAA